MVMAVEHGTTIDLHDLADRELPQDRSGIRECRSRQLGGVHADSLGADPSITSAPTEAMKTGGGQVCPGRCLRAAKGTGSVMLKSKVWFQRRRQPPPQASGVIGTDSVTFRITDGKPTHSAPRRPAEPASRRATVTPMCAKRLWGLRCGRH